MGSPSPMRTRRFSMPPIKAHTSSASLPSNPPPSPHPSAWEKNFAAFGTIADRDVSKGCPHEELADAFVHA